MIFFGTFRHFFCTFFIFIYFQKIFIICFLFVFSYNSVELECSLFKLELFTDAISNKLQANNIFTVTKLATDGRQLMYLSVKITIGIWILCELKLNAIPSGHTLALKSRVPDVYSGIVEAFQGILLN